MLVELLSYISVIVIIGFIYLRSMKEVFLYLIITLKKAF